MLQVTVNIKISVEKWKITWLRDKKWIVPKIKMQHFKN